MTQNYYYFSYRLEFRSHFIFLLHILHNLLLLFLKKIKVYEIKNLHVNIFKEFYSIPLHNFVFITKTPVLRNTECIIVIL